MTRQIREFVFSTDYRKVLELWQNAGTGIQLSISDQPEEIQKKITRDPDLFLVAEEGGSLIGTVLGGFDGRRGMVYHLAVPPELRRQGIATELMDELETRLRAKGCLKYYLLVTKDNQAALDFYASQGSEMMPLFVLGKVLG